MRGGRDGTGYGSPGSPHRDVLGTVEQMFPDKGHSTVPEVKLTVKEAETRIHKKGKTFVEERIYSREELEKVRENAKYAGLGFYGIHDDDTLRIVLNGGKYDPSVDDIPPPVREEYPVKEFATILITRPGGCSLLHGPFAISLDGALHKIINIWGSRLTWTAQREHSSQIVGAMDSFYASAHFLSVLDQRADGVNWLTSRAAWDGG